METFMKTTKTRIFSTATAAVFCSALAMPVFSETSHQDRSADSKYKEQRDHKSTQSEDRYDVSKPDLRNAWLEGKLETALLVNRHLNNFTIDNEVRNGKATLTGSVESEVDKELAEQVALSIEGVEDVDNQLKVDPEKAKSQRERSSRERSFSQKFDDMTTTAAVKSKLLANQSTHGLDINVDTVNSVVSLSGDVATTEEKQLAEKIAGNTDDVRKVKNLLKVKPKS
jgi:osmotically-inducible protein OsmY|tara:strand:+ start:575 stop:1255 length:681 start_codon:yes stop_codon:yes gene_type:complete